MFCAMSDLHRASVICHHKHNIARTEHTKNRVVANNTYEALSIPYGRGSKGSTRVILCTPGIRKAVPVD